MKMLDDAVGTLLVRQMDACTVRQKVIANNVANANTPNFKKSTVNFQQQLQAALDNRAFQMQASHRRHITPTKSELETLTPEVVQVEGTAMKANGNNVDVDEEMVNLAANSLLYQLATTVKSDRTNLLSYVIKGGR